MSEKPMTKAEMIEAMADLLSTAGLLTQERIIQLAGLKGMKKVTLTKVFTLFLISFKAGLG